MYFGIPTFLQQCNTKYIQYTQNQLQMLENHDLSRPLKGEGFLPQLLDLGKTYDGAPGSSGKVLD